MTSLPRLTALFVVAIFLGSDAARVVELDTPVRPDRTLLARPARSSDARMLIEQQLLGMPSLPHIPRTHIAELQPSVDIPLSDPLLAPPKEEMEPQQIHISLWNDTTMLISWAQGNGMVYPASKAPDTRYNTSGVTGVVWYGTSSSKLGEKATCEPITYTYRYGAAAGTLDGEGTVYHSPLLFHVLLAGLVPGQSYSYRVGSGGRWSKAFAFTQPRAAGKDAYPFRLGIMGDVGQTWNSSRTLAGIASFAPDILLLVGDLTYADDYSANGTLWGAWPTPASYQPRWDSWGRLSQRLASRIPLQTSIGNHESEEIQQNLAITAYAARYPVPQDPACINTSPNDYLLYADPSRTATFAAGKDDPSVHYNNSWYSFNAGPAHIVFITSYVPYDEASEQYRWFIADMKTVDRAATPWLVVSFHAPWYNSYDGHFKENAAMQRVFEPLFWTYGVDLVYSGHVHAYERSTPVYQWQPNACGAIYTTIGDGGNIEGIYRDYIDVQPRPDFCANTSAYQMPSYQLTNDGKTYVDPNEPFCYDSQPAWSDYRQPSFGFGELILVNESYATWAWYPEHGHNVTFDNIGIWRSIPGECARRQLPPAQQPQPGSPAAMALASASAAGAAKSDISSAGNAAASAAAATAGSAALCAALAAALAGATVLLLT